MCEAGGTNHQIESEPENTQPDGARDELEAAAGKSLVHYTFDEAGPGNTSTADVWPSNSATTKETHYEEFSRKKRFASNSSFDGLRTHAEMGNHLHEIKRLAGHGTFEREVKDRLGINKAWRVRLMNLGEQWPEILTAIAWGEANNRLTRSEYSVDGALRLLKEWQLKVENNDNNDLAGQTINLSAGNKKVSKKQLEKQVDDLKRQLEEAHRLIAILGAEVDRLRKELHPDVLIADHIVPPLLAVEEVNH